MKDIGKIGSSAVYCTVDSTKPHNPARVRRCSGYSTVHRGARSTREERFSCACIIDLSVGLVPDAVHKPLKHEITYQTHGGEGAEILARLFGVTNPCSCCGR